MCAVDPTRLCGSFFIFLQSTVDRLCLLTNTAPHSVALFAPDWFMSEYSAGGYMFGSKSTSRKRYLKYCSLNANGRTLHYTVHILDFYCRQQQAEPIAMIGNERNRITGHGHTVKQRRSGATYIWTRSTALRINNGIAVRLDRP